MAAVFCCRRLAFAARVGHLQAGRFAPGPISTLLARPRCNTRLFCASSSRPTEGTDSGEHAEGRDADDPGNTLSVSGVRVYRREVPENQHKFRWGIGNRFRANSQNRFSPVHLERPKEVSIREDYFENDNPNIVWESLNETWEVYWYEHNKLNAKPFPVKKFGIELCKKEAFAFYEELKIAGRLGKKREHDRSQEGIFYDERFQDWVAFVQKDGRPVSRAFSASKFGYDGAKRLALAKQRDPANGVLPVRRASDGSKRAWEKKMLESEA